MKKNEDFRPQISELIDMLDQQKAIAKNLLEEAKPFDKTGEFVKGLQLYLSKLDEQDEIIFNVAKKMEVSFENDLYKKMVEK